MTATFINFEKRITVNLELSLGNSQPQKIYDWLYKNHEDLFWEIELHETGTKGISVTPGEIYISGDNGVLILERVYIKSINY